ncbi:MAG: FGGY-family carbohydrate kinase [Candidatus Choladocola sp.]|nr:FGGY-family carbohydrate kinase [Candidatus Choladocola sp.]
MKGHMHIVVIDVGTSSMRGILYTEKAEILHVHQITYEVQYLSQNRAEQDPDDWKKALFEIGAAMAVYAEEKGITIDALSLTSQRSSVIPVDREGKPLRSAIMWLDKRNAAICESLKPAEGEIARRTGARINAVFSGSKMTWIHRNEPEIYNRAYRILTIADYLSWLMTGEYKTDHTYGSRSSLMNIRTRQWDDELLNMYEVDREKLCELISPGDILGYTSQSFSEATGLPTGIPMISAGGDQQCAALGMGVISKGDMELTTGTGAFLIAYTDCVPENLGSEVICGAHAVRGKYVLESSMLSCSSLYDWFRTQFYPNSEKYKEINHEVEESPAGAGGCIALPYFQGRGTPDWNSSATGSFLNLTLNTRRCDMARAVLESIACEAKSNIEVLEQYAGTARQLYISGGLTNFGVFNQMQADVYQKQLIRSENPEQTSLGGLISALVSLGACEDYQSALAQVKEQEKTVSYEPDPERREIYENKCSIMQQLYRKLYP